MSVVAEAPGIEPVPDDIVDWFVAFLRGEAAS